MHLGVETYSKAVTVMEGMYVMTLCNFFLFRNITSDLKRILKGEVHLQYTYQKQLTLCLKFYV